MHGWCAIMCHHARHDPAGAETRAGPLAEEGVTDEHPAASPVLLASLSRTFSPNLLGVRLVPGFEQPLRTELDSLAADSRVLARRVLGGVPSPVRRLLGLP
jgi:hypothetical protein